MPPRLAITSCANSSAVCNCVVALTAMVVVPLDKKPSGEVTLAALSALRNWSGDRPMALSMRRLTSTRMAGVAAPAISTDDTPFNCRRRCASKVSAALYRSAADCVSESSAKAMIGSSLGLAFS